MSIFKKNIVKITLTDIEELIAQKVRESSLIEYKEANFLKPDRNDLQQQFWKLIKRICGFANNMGGLLILGIKEDSNSCADSITPLYQPKTDLINKLRGLTISHTIPSISLKINDIDTNPSNPDEYILVLKILDAPEPVMYINSSDNDSHKYFYRYNEDTIPADHATVRLLFSKKSIEEKLNEYLESRDYGLKIGDEENVVSWIAIPYQFPLETFTEINYSTINTLKKLYPDKTGDDRIKVLLEKGKLAHNGVLFLYRYRILYYGFFEIKRNGYIEFRTLIEKNEEFLNERYIIEDFDKFIEYLFHFYSYYDYFGDIRIILSFKKSDITLKLGIKDIGGGYMHDNDRNFSLENKIHIERVFSTKDLELEKNRLKLFKDFKKELHTCFGISD